VLQYPSKKSGGGCTSPLYVHESKLSWKRKNAGKPHTKKHALSHTKVQRQRQRQGQRQRQVDTDTDIFTANDGHTYVYV